MEGMDWLLTGISVISTICAIVFGYAAFSRSKRQDDSESGAKNASLMSELGYIKSSLDDIKRQQEKQDEKREAQHLDVITRLTAVEASSKQAHKRIDGLSGKRPAG